MIEKVKIELTPYNSLAILKFCREFINDENKDDYIFQPIHEAVNEFEQQVYKKMSPTQLDQAIHENSVNKLIGKFPTDQ